MPTPTPMPAPAPGPGSTDAPSRLPRRRRRWAGAALGMGLGVVLFAVGQGVVLDRSGGDFAMTLRALGLLFGLAVVISLFVQAARQDWRQTAATATATRAAARRPRRDAYWFTAGVALAGVVVLALTAAGVRLAPPMLPAAARPAVERDADADESRDVRRPDDESGRPAQPRAPYNRPFYRGE